MADEHSLNFFHGTLLDEDADVFLVQDGDYLIQARPDRRYGPPKLILAVKKGQRKVRRIDIVKIEGTGYRVLGKLYADLQQLINHFSTHPLELANGDTVYLKRPIPKGEFSFIHNDSRFQKKIRTDSYSTVYKGVMVKDGRQIVIKQVDSYFYNERELLDLLQNTKIMIAEEYLIGIIADRPPFLFLMDMDILKTAGKIIEARGKTGRSTNGTPNNATNNENGQRPNPQPPVITEIDLDPKGKPGRWGVPCFLKDNESTYKLYYNGFLYYDIFKLR